jgi:cell division protein FtsN
VKTLPTAAPQNIAPTQVTVTTQNTSDSLPAAAIPAAERPSEAADPGAVVPVTHPTESAEVVAMKGVPVKSGKTYRIQVASYSQAQNAVALFDKLISIGLNPSYERFENKYRVVLPQVQAEDIEAVTKKLFDLGIKEAIAREERLR